MPAKLTELTLVYRREKIRWDAVAILECEEVASEMPKESLPDFLCGGGGCLTKIDLLARDTSVTVKTECPPDELVQGLSYRFYGHWTEHEKYGRQFLAKTYVMVQPHGRQGVIQYLVATCAGCGVGQQTARKLYDKFEGNAVKVLRESPEVAVAAVAMSHFTEEKATAASRILCEKMALEAVHIDLIDLLGGRGFPRDTAKKAVSEWGNKAAELIRRNPYLLMRFRGCGYLRTDQLYLDQGGRPAALKRQALAAWYAIARDTDGHTWHRPETAECGIKGRVSGAEVDALQALKLAKRAKLLSVVRNGDGSPWLAESRKADNERDVSDCVRAMLGQPVRWPEVDGLDISDHQKEELSNALQSPIALFGGSPGTGKTYSAARLIGRIIELCGSDQVAVCAPTGKAAVRISEALAGYEVNKSATTIHRLLGVESNTAGEGWGFKHGESNPLPFKYIIVDESSMIDTDLMASLLRACAVGTHLMLVGDVNQLPPVGHGAPLRDMIAAGVPTGDLKKIERNWGTIVQACADIRDGKRWKTVEQLDPDAGQNLKIIPASNGAAAAEKIVATIQKIKELQLYDPIWSVQVIVAVNKKSELSRRDLNKRLQMELNPDGQRAGGNPFRVGDKVVCLKNGFYSIPDSVDSEEENEDADAGKVFVANGEQARVIAVAEKITTVRLESPLRTVKIPRGTGSENGGEKADEEKDDSAASTNTGCQWDLAYAISCHKSQGSEWPCVIVALDEYPGARRICDRSWIYTAISRAKGVCLLVGKRQTAESMCAFKKIQNRKTFLKERILGTVK